MFQRLLVERFALQTHVEQRPLPVNELSIAPSGLKMRPATAEEIEKTGHRDGLSLDISMRGNQTLITATALPDDDQLLPGALHGRFCSDQAI